MSIRLETPNLPRSKTGKQMQPTKQYGTVASSALYSGTSSAGRAIQQQQQRYLGSSSYWRSIQLKREFERTSPIVTKKSDPIVTYHPWESEYSKIIMREKRLKPMTKYPYTPMLRLVSHAVEKITIEADCCPTLIPAEAVKIRTVKIRQNPRPSMPKIIRYLRRDELMPSERSALVSNSEEDSLPSLSENKKPIASFLDTNKTTGVAPTLATTSRLLNRAKMRTDPSDIRRPPRKLIMNVNHETIMPLSVYG